MRPTSFAASLRHSEAIKPAPPNVFAEQSNQALGLASAFVSDVAREFGRLSLTSGFREAALPEWACEARHELLRNEPLRQSMADVAVRGRMVSAEALRVAAGCLGRALSHWSAELGEARKAAIEADERRCDAADGAAPLPCPGMSKQEV